ncbi:kinetochore Sim4 complex subunit Fta4 [Thelonectria olida]|uniref:Kinetochore Sim4 complex subunit Fta4 n=1 Tax=Thelonectria olida TaxID=1576542 RepID=A0A9P8VUS6_9HYPO|nr:kinetochore Sim4 complex subunit Fta4 [Thelonectria olida]
MASSSAPTIPQLKQAFLFRQITLLSQPLAPSRTWQAANDASDAPLPERAVDDALFTLNHSVTQHCRRVYAPQATRNISEQIDNVYAKEAERRFDTGLDDEVEGALGRDVDLTDHSTIEALPEAWISDKDITDYPMEAKRYADNVQRLAELDQQRKKLRDQVDRLKRLQAVVKPLETEDSGVGLQENLLTRGGPVEKELERMRILLARVGGRVNMLPEAEESGPPNVQVTSSESLQQARKRRVDEFLADNKVFPS